jgi:stress-induced morphogen
MTEERARRLADELSRHFNGQAEIEAVAPGRYRFAIVSPQFEGVGQLQRQDRAWEVVDQVFTREEVLDISLILAFAPGELQPVPPA